MLSKYLDGVVMSLTDLTSPAVCACTRPDTGLQSLHCSLFLGIVLIVDRFSTYQWWIYLFLFNTKCLGSNTALHTLYINFEQLYYDVVAHFRA